MMMPADLATFKCRANEPGRHDHQSMKRAAGNARPASMSSSQSRSATWGSCHRVPMRNGGRATST